MKKQILLTLLLTSLSCLAENNSSPSPFDGYSENQESNGEQSPFAAVGSGFNYQGELLNAGVAVNGNFDFAFILYDSPVNGNQIGSNVIKGNRPVNSGLFSLEDIDFGDAAYSGDELWLSVTVRETGNPGSETTLSPRQKINATPYAVQADFLSPLNDISIGTTTSTHRLTVQSNLDTQVLRLIGPNNFGHGARLNFGDAQRVYIDEPTDDDLTIHAFGDITMDGDVKQPITSNGIMKYMVYSICSLTPTIVRSYNGVSTAAITIANGATFPSTCRFKFPELISNRYFQVTAMGAPGTTGQGVSCHVLTGVSQPGDTLECTSFNTANGTPQDAYIMILVY